MFKIKKLSPDAQIPTLATAGSAGYDLYSPIDCTVPSNGQTLIPTGLAFSIPSGHYGQVSSRSSLSLRFQIEVGAGVIDESYRGNVGVLLRNHSKTDYPIKKGDRIAQLILHKISTPSIVEVDELDQTERGSGGFGSTGK